MRTDRASLPKQITYALCAGSAGLPKTALEIISVFRIKGAVRRLRALKYGRGRSKEAYADELKRETGGLACR